MPRIKTESLQPGMIVASDVKNIDTMLLIPAGCALTERQIDILQAWGAGELDVQAYETGQDSGDPLEKLSPEVVERLSAEVKALFWKPEDGDPVFEEVFKLMRQRRARKALAK